MALLAKVLDTCSVDNYIDLYVILEDHYSISNLVLAKFQDISYYHSINDDNLELLETKIEDRDIIKHNTEILQKFPEDLERNSNDLERIKSFGELNSNEEYISINIKK